MAKSNVQHIACYRIDGVTYVGRVDGDSFARMDNLPWQGGQETGVRDARDGATLLAPVQPTKIICVGLNYASHIPESVTAVPGASKPEEPVLFFKPPSAVIPTRAAIRYPAGVTRLDPEAEMGVVIGRRARRVTAAAASDYIAGLTCFNDMSARNYQRKDRQWTRAKGFDTFAPLGPWVAVGLSPERLGVQSRVNGEVRQSGNTSDLLFKVPTLVSYISHIMTLEPGDVIATGTPAGIAPVEVGDRIEIEVEGIGVLENHVEDGRG